MVAGGGRNAGFSRQRLAVTVGLQEIPARLGGAAFCRL